jgi:hypothetical protein
VAAAQVLATAILSQAKKEADQRRERNFGYSTEQGPIAARRRKHLILNARQIAERFGLQDELQGWVYAAGKEEITGLDVIEVAALVNWLERAAERIETICDRADTPPAR